MPSLSQPPHPADREGLPGPAGVCQGPALGTPQPWLVDKWTAAMGRPSSIIRAWLNHGMGAAPGTYTCELAELGLDRNQFQGPGKETLGLD